MKNEDLKKLYKEGKQDLSLCRFFLKATFLLITFSLNSFAQIPLNGFCRFNEFPSKANSSKIFAVDYNNDGRCDLLILSDKEKNFSIQTWTGEKFSNPIERYSPFFLYDIQLLSSPNRTGKRYAYFSRKDRLIGIASFSKSGSISIQSKLKIQGFASGFDFNDINHDGKIEILIYGSGFQGLSIFNEYKNTFKELKLNLERVFAYAAFIDLDYDNYSDIAAIELLSNSIFLFYNDGTGNFKENRIIRIDSDARQFKFADVNSDGFNDLIYTNKNNFVILCGDSVSSFNKKIIINGDVIPDKYVVFDFNADGYNDIAFINRETGSLYIAFAKSSYSFYEPILYLKRKGITDIDAYVDRGGRKLIVLDQNGKVYLIDKVAAVNKNFSISLSLKPTVIGDFSYMFETMRGIYFIDENDFTLKILMGGNGNYFETFYKLPISQIYTKVEVDETQPNIRTFYCYSRYSSVIEIIRINFESQQISRRVLYAKGTIEDLKLTSDRLKDRQTIYVLINKNKRLALESFDFRDFRYVNSGFYEIAENVDAAALSFNIYKEIFFYTKFNNVLYLNKSIFDRKIGNAINLSATIINQTENISFEVKSFSNQYNIESPAVGWINNKDRTILTVINKGNYRTITITDFSATKNYLYFTNLSNKNNLFLYDKYRGKLKRISFGKNYLSYELRDVFESKTINGYIAMQLRNNKEILIFIDSDDNLIKFKYIQ